MRQSALPWWEFPGLEFLAVYCCIDPCHLACGGAFPWRIRSVSPAISAYSTWIGCKYCILRKQERSTWKVREGLTTEKYNIFNFRDCPFRGFGMGSGAQMLFMHKNKNRFSRPQKLPRCACVWLDVKMHSMPWLKQESQHIVCVFLKASKSMAESWVLPSRASPLLAFHSFHQPLVNLREEKNAPYHLYCSTANVCIPWIFVYSSSEQLVLKSHFVNHSGNRHCWVW